MRLKIKDVNIYVEELVFLTIFLSVIFKEVREYFENYFICYLFIAFHEFAHMFVASIFDIKTTRISICISGLNINLNNKNRKGIKWFAIFFAGPISNIILALLFLKVPIVYTINLVLAVTNLLPIYPLDGYNIVKILLGILKIKNEQKMLNIIQSIFLVLFGILGVYQVIFLNNLSMILMLFYIFIHSEISRKNSNLRLYQKCYKNVTIFD